MAKREKPVFRAVYAAPCRPETTMDVCNLLGKTPDDLRREILEAYNKTKNTKGAVARG